MLVLKIIWGEMRLNEPEMNQLEMQHSCADTAKDLHMTYLVLPALYYATMQTEIGETLMQNRSCEQH